ncbi:Peroxisome proliferator-activated receptor gamma coactivator 1-alpha [Galemys pyrenaicus]|uniref:Peroxisome proliferator-activated receptor gamma coactivator 1-alpha n=1 Tax=Galemys pyrenaicus TaxID=202257 RepID=A0A8J6AFC1_GALPY|nr:Peroxisome proliferator-activated receptor gamma coactivator 1-alpha [Galemys pyrenaicus]
MEEKGKKRTVEYGERGKEAVKAKRELNIETVREARKDQGWSWMAWDMCNQDSVWSDIECAALVGEDQPLCPDLPELDLSELDVNDLDTDSFLGGLKWCSDQSEIISNQYSNEPSNIFERIEVNACAEMLIGISISFFLPVPSPGLHAQHISELR